MNINEGIDPLQTETSDPLTFSIGAAMMVHRELGSRFLEAVYQKGLAYEFSQQGILFQKEVEIPVFIEASPSKQIIELILFAFQNHCRDQSCPKLTAVEDCTSYQLS